MTERRRIRDADELRERRAQQEKQWEAERERRRGVDETLERLREEQAPLVQPAKTR